MINLNQNITIIDTTRKKHSKASEEYIHVVFKYTNSNWDGWVPVEYRRTGTLIKTNSELVDYLNKVYDQMNPINLDSWTNKQIQYWKEEKPNASTTKKFFDILITGGWQCVECKLPKNPNWARRIQDLKEFGYTLATDTKRYCPNCNSNKSHIILLPIPRGNNSGNGYETWTPKLRKHIIKTLNGIDVYENKKNQHCLPDHKFSEIRWDDTTKDINPDSMTDSEIRDKFQLLSNQRNQQKREVCRNCFQTGERGTIFGIPFFHKGSEKWDSSIPTKGKDAEKGCIGCPWHDIEAWRNELIKKLNT